jgi:hypothetical protein
VIQNGHLFLSLMADGGIYEFEPMSPEGSVEGAVKGTASYRERMALPPGAVLEATLEDVSRADAAAEVIGRGCGSRIRATLRSDSRSRTTRHASIQVGVTRCGPGSWSMRSRSSSRTSTTRC